VSWNHVVVLGVLINVATLALGWRMRSASPASIERRCRWVIRLTLGLAAVLLVSVLVPLARFAWLFAHDAPPEDLAGVLGAAIASGMNLVMGFLAFGTFPTGMAFRMARLSQPEPQPESHPHSELDPRTTGKRGESMELDRPPPSA
jgi:hypothetical protein